MIHTHPPSMRMIIFTNTPILSSLIVIWVVCTRVAINWLIEILLSLMKRTMIRSNVIPVMNTVLYQNHHSLHNHNHPSFLLALFNHSFICIFYLLLITIRMMSNNKKSSVRYSNEEFMETTLAIQPLYYRLFTSRYYHSFMISFFILSNLLLFYEVFYHTNTSNT